MYVNCKKEKNFKICKNKSQKNIGWIFKRENIIYIRV